MFLLPDYFLNFHLSPNAITRRKAVDHWLNGIAYQPSHWPDRNVDWREMLRRTWLVTMGGGYPNYYYSHTAWLCRPSSLY